MTSTASDTPPRLTSLSHGGGCGCKIAPGVLSELLARSSLPPQFFPELLVGSETNSAQCSYSSRSQRSSMKVSFASPSVTITWAIAVSTATLVPGRSGR